MSGFDADWLRLREPFDAAARDRGLARRFGAALAPREPRRIVDLAAGTGANFRVLAPGLGGDQDWLLVDHDPRLILTQAADIATWARRNGWRCRTIEDGVEVDAGGARWRARAHACDLARDLESIDFASSDGVTTTAFLDLVSAAWLDRLCDLLATRPLPLLATLTVDGRRAWHPPMPADARVNDAFGRHQARDKGFGAALGGEAANRLAGKLAERGFEVTTARSDWRIGAAEREMLIQMVDESHAAAREAGPAYADVFIAWSAARRAQARTGSLSLDIGHVDLLAISAGARRD